jgi:uncharacterized phage protein (predicted DNA packaging)
MFITLEQVKQHLYISHNHDDLLIADYITVAEDAVCKDLNIHCLDEIIQSNGLLPACVLQAVLLLVGSLYNARESISFNQIHKNPVYNYLLSLYRNYNDTLYNF